MLTSDQFDDLVQPLTEFWQEYTDSVVNDIARRLKKLGDPSQVTAMAAWQAQRLSESGLLYEDILRQVSRKTGISQSMLRKAFRDAGVKTMKFDDDIYRAAGLNPAPLNLSPAMLEVLRTGLARTGGIVENFTRTTALAGQQSFLRASDLAYQQVITGAFDYNTAIKSAVKRVAGEGLRVIPYPGRTDQLDVAMRRAVLTGIGQTTGQLQLTRAEELGVDLVQTSAHIGARPEHGEWQGRVFSRGGSSDKYPPFLDSTGYGTATGLLGINCRHSFFPFFEGLSENAYDKATLDEYANKTVKYNGRQIPMYEATQRQRATERNIRKWKREADALGAAGLDNSAELNRVKLWQAKARDFVKQTGLPRQGAREQVLQVSDIVQ